MNYQNNIERTPLARLVIVLVASTFPIACSTTLVSIRSEPIALVDIESGLIETNPGTSSVVRLPNATIFVQAMNKVGLSSEARVLGVETSENSFGMSRLGGVPFVIGLYVDLGATAMLDVSEPVLSVSGKEIKGVVLTPMTSEYPRTDCIQAEGSFEQVNSDFFSRKHDVDDQTEGFCLRYEFPVEPINPRQNFSVYFGSVVFGNKEVDLRIRFAGVVSEYTNTR